MRQRSHDPSMDGESGVQAAQEFVQRALPRLFKDMTRSTS
jgi:hypothetical protein